MSVPDTLAAGIVTLGLEALPDSVHGRLLQYQALLLKWGQVYNLTALHDPADILTHHILDSLAVVLPLRRQLDTRTAGRPAPTLLDVGSGAGLPGVVLAVCLPELQVTCLDAVAKKAAFVRQVALALQLPNLHSVHGRIEQCRERFDIVCSRAFASLDDFTRLSAHCLQPDGKWLAMKGKTPNAELLSLPAAVQVDPIESLQVPGLHAERCIVWMRQNTC